MKRTTNDAWSDRQPKTPDVGQAVLSSTPTVDLTTPSSSVDYSKGEYSFTNQLDYTHSHSPFLFILHRYVQHGHRD